MIKKVLAKCQAIMKTNLLSIYTQSRLLKASIYNPELDTFI